MYIGQSDKVQHASRPPAPGDTVRRAGRGVDTIAEYTPEQGPAELIAGQWRQVYRARVHFHKFGLLETVRVIESPRGVCNWKEV